MVNKVTIIVSETKKHLQFLDVGRRSLLLNCLRFFKIRLNSANKDNVSQVPQFSETKFTFGRLFKKRVKSEFGLN